MIDLDKLYNLYNFHPSVINAVKGSMNDVNGFNDIVREIDHKIENLTIDSRKNNLRIRNEELSADMVKDIESKNTNNKNAIEDLYCLKYKNQDKIMEINNFMSSLQLVSDYLNKYNNNNT